MRLRCLVLLAAAIGAAQPAAAAVKLSFYSRDSGTYFPHAFVALSGATDADPGRAISTNYGFTARILTPAILIGPVSGEILTSDPGYVNGSQRHFSVTLSDAQYDQLIAMIAQWRAIPGHSYDLKHRNCVHFVKAVAELVGLDTAHTERLMLKPRSFLDEVGFENGGRVNMADAYVPKLARDGDEGKGRHSLQSAGSEQPLPPPAAPHP